LQGQVAVSIYNVSGQLVQQTNLEYVSANAPNQVILTHSGTGYYVVHIHSGNVNLSQGIIIQ
jgi:hypothetical protein